MFKHEKKKKKKIKFFKIIKKKIPVDVIFQRATVGTGERFKNIFKKRPKRKSNMFVVNLYS